MSKLNIEICRVYAPPKSKKGAWLLVDRLWPRGLKKEKLSFDEWLKEISPSPALRTWFNHDHDKQVEFANKYVYELKDKAELITEVLKKAKKSGIVLFYAAKDEQYNHARVLKAALESWPKLPKFKKQLTIRKIVTGMTIT